MIIAVRLRQYSRKGENRMRTYTAVDGKRYIAGSVGQEPSTIYNVQASQLAEFSAIPQFQVMSFESMKELDAFVQLEMEHVARSGGSMVRARMVGFPEDAAAVPFMTPMPEPVLVPVEMPKPKMIPAILKLKPTELKETPEEEEEMPEEEAAKEVPKPSPKTGKKSRPRPRKSSKK